MRSCRVRDSETPQEGLPGEAGTVAFPEMVLKGFETVGVGGAIGSWGWDIGDGPYANSTSGVLDRQLQVMELTKNHPSVKGWVTLVGHDLMSDELVQKASNLAKDNLCLLYTSPSPRDLSTSRMPSSA